MSAAAGSVVSNSSPLIALDQIDQLELLTQLFGNLTIPPAVANEITSLILPDWISERPLIQPIEPDDFAASLGPGECEAIRLATECKATWVILDDRPARRLAKALGIPVVGTIGILVAAKRRGMLAEVRSSLDGLLQHGFFVAPSLYKQVLKQVGE